MTITVIIYSLPLADMFIIQCQEWPSDREHVHATDT